MLHSAHGATHSVVEEWFQVLGTGVSLRRSQNGFWEPGITQVLGTGYHSGFGNRGITQEVQNGGSLRRSKNGW